MNARRIAPTSMIKQRLELHESAGQDLRRGHYVSAAHTIRRLMMTLPLDHPARRDLLTVLTFVEKAAPSAKSSTELGWSEPE
jgi:hypothetical protein